MMAKKYLIITPVSTHPRQTGVGTRLMRLVELLREFDVEVHCAFIPGIFISDIASMKEFWGERLHLLPPKIKKKANLFERWRRRIHRKGLSLKADLSGGWPWLSPWMRLPFDEWYSPSVKESLSKLASTTRFDGIIVQYYRFTKAFQAFDSDARKIIDTIDIFAGRHKLQEEAGLKPDWWSASRNEEAISLKRGDVVLAITKEDEAYFRSLIGKRVVRFGHSGFPTINVPDPNSVTTPTLLFIGGKHPFNRQAVTYFNESIFPIIQAKVPSVSLLIAGAVCAELPKIERTGLTLLGIVPDLADLYRQTSVVINPVRGGTGQGIKTIEALMYGKPVVTTSAGARGILEAGGRAFLVADAAEDFARAVLRIIDNPELAVDLSNNAIEFCRQRHEHDRSALIQILA